MSAIGDGQRDGARGFTLIEMLVILAIAGLIASLAFPAVERGFTRQAFEGAAAQLDGALRSARADALRTGRPVVVVLPKDLPAGITIAAPERPLIFYADGSSSGAALALNAGERRRVLMVSADTGLVRTER